MAKKRKRGRPVGRKYGEVIRVRVAAELLARLDSACDGRERSAVVRDALEAHLPPAP